MVGVCGNGCLALDTLRASVVAHGFSPTSVRIIAEMRPMEHFTDILRLR